MSDRGSGFGARRVGQGEGTLGEAIFAYGFLFVAGGVLGAGWGYLSPALIASQSRVGSRLMDVEATDGVDATRRFRAVVGALAGIGAAAVVAVSSAKPSA